MYYEDQDDLGYHNDAGYSEARCEELENDFRIQMGLSWDDLKNPAIKLAFNMAIDLLRMDETITWEQAEDLYYDKLEELS